MNPTLKKISFLLPLLPLLFYSCIKKEIEETEVAPRYSWTINDSFLYKHKIQLNSYESETALYLLGFEGLSKIYYKEEVEYAERYFKVNKSPVEYKYPLNEDVFTETGHSTVSFTSVQNPVSLSTSRIATVRMADIDPAFAKFDFPTYETGACFGLMKNNVALIPYMVYDSKDNSDPVISGTKLLLVKLELTGTDKDKPVVSKTMVIDKRPEYNEVYQIHDFDNYFYVTYSQDKLARVSEDGDFEELMEKGLSPMFKHDGALYGFSRDGLYKSRDGKDWGRILSATSSVSFFDLGRLNYHTLSNGLLIATYNSQLFKIELSESELLLKELDNSGLDGNKITSIARFNNKIYLTTLSGVFSRGEDKFLTLKQEELE